MTTTNRRHLRGWQTRRRGAATLDYVLVLGVILPLATICIPMGIRLIRPVYEMICVLISWPFM